MEQGTPTFAVVGRVNKGKSSVVSTLVEDDTVRVDKEPGTTRVCTRFPFRADDGRVLCTVVDTPGFEEAPRALAWLRESEGSAAERPALVAKFVETFEGGAEFADECALLQPILAGAAILYVVDASLPYRPNYEAEMEILRWTGRARMALVNRIGGDDHIEEWKRALGQYFSVVRVFDAHRSGFAERIGLLRAFRELDDTARSRIDEAIARPRERLATSARAFRGDHRRARRRRAHLHGRASARRARRHRAASAEMGNGVSRAAAQARAACPRRDRAALSPRAARARRAALDRERFEWDLFAQESRRVFGLDTWQLVRAGAIGGAAIGGTIDAATLGHSFLVGSLVGGVIGGIASYFGTQRAAEVTVLGQTVAGRVVAIGPLGDTQFPWILLDRAHSSLRIGGRARARQARRAHGRAERRQSRSVEHARPRRARVASAVSSRAFAGAPRPCSDELVDALATSILPLLEHAVDVSR